MAGEPNLLNVRGIIPANPEQNIPIKPGTGAYPFPVEPGAWAAVHLGVTRTQIMKDASASAASVVIRTVTAGKTFYLTTATLSVYHTANAYGSIIIRNVADVYVGPVAFCYCSPSIAGICTLTYPMPIVIAAGFDIVVTNNLGTSIATISGWEQ